MWFRIRSVLGCPQCGVDANPLSWRDWERRTSATSVVGRHCIGIPDCGETGNVAIVRRRWWGANNTMTKPPRRPRWCLGLRPEASVWFCIRSVLGCPQCGVAGNPLLWRDWERRTNATSVVGRHCRGIPDRGETGNVAIVRRRWWGANNTMTKPPRRP